MLRNHWSFKQNLFKNPVKKVVFREFAGLQLQPATLRKSKFCIDIFENFCLLFRDIYFKDRVQSTLNNYFLGQKIMTFPAGNTLFAYCRYDQQMYCRRVFYEDMFILNKWTTSQLLKRLSQNKNKNHWTKNENFH